MYMKKSVGPVGAMSYPDEVWGRCKPLQGPRLVSGGRKGAKSPESPKILHFARPKMVKNNKISDDGSQTCNPSVINQVLWPLS